MRCEQPSAKLYKFDGAIVDCLDLSQPHVPLTADNLILRGCTLRKTSWVVSVWGRSVAACVEKELKRGGWWW